MTKKDVKRLVQFAYDVVQLREYVSQRGSAAEVKAAGTMLRAALRNAVEGLTEYHEQLQEKVASDV